MSEVKWLKIRVDMFDDEKIKIIQAMPEGDALLVVWIKLITLAGKTNDGGYIYISENVPYTEEMLSVIMNKSLPIIRLALNTFVGLGMVENDEKGIYLVNFEKHQSLDKLERIREQNRLRKRRQREREKQALLEEKNGVTHDITHSHDTDIDKDKEEDIDIIINTSTSDVSSDNDKIKNDLSYAETIRQVINYMNKCGETQGFTKVKTFDFKPKAKSNEKVIKARLNEGYDLEDFKDVIFNAYDKFIEHEYKGLNGKSSVQYYNPTTIFTSEKMEKYKSEYKYM